MKTLVGLKKLIVERDTLPQVGWIFVERGYNKVSMEALMNAQFYIPENDDDEFFGEDNLATWMEVPIFVQVLRLRDKNIPSPTLEQYANAAIHYLESDDFIE
jgi:hypothetical protein